MAAEIVSAWTRSGPALTRFNEAAANGRGNRGSGTGTTALRPCFNEAAANGRGNHERYGGGAASRPGFNEAAANGRGNLELQADNAMLREELQ